MDRNCTANPRLRSLGMLDPFSGRVGFQLSRLTFPTARYNRCRSNRLQPVTGDRMKSVAGQTLGQRSSIRQVAFASFIGTSIEWYDFFIYGTASALVFPHLFFPNFSPLAGTLASFATFGVGFFARPIGGLVFGHFGDRVGRKSMLVITLFLMGTATFSVGLLPTFKQWGIFASLLLVVLRFVQGFAVGGEWGGATLMTAEHAPEESRSFYTSWPQLGVPAGLMLSTVVFGAFSSLRNEQFFAWGWRMPFLSSIILIVVGFFIRMRVIESPAFSRMKQLGGEAKLPLLELLRDYHLAALLAVGVNVVNLGAFYIVTTFALSYVTGRFGLGRNVPLIGIFLAGATEFAGILIFARLADRIGKRPVAIWSAGCLVLLSYPFFWLVDSGRPGLIWVAMSAVELAGGAFYAVSGAFTAEFFETRVRYSGISFGYQMAAMLVGAPTPMICTALVHWSGGASWPVATYLASVSLISFVAVCLAADRCRAGVVNDLNVQPDEA